MIEEKQKVDIVLTSPPYNTGRVSSSEHWRNEYQGKYDIHIDNMKQEEYLEWTKQLFTLYNSILNDNGVILYNMSYGSDNTMNTESVGLMWLTIADIIKNTEFIPVDRIIWKKKSALPNNTSSNKLTRIVEDIFVCCRKSEIKTFNCNKQVTSIRKDRPTQKYYENIFNYIEAKNNDGSCNLNKATFSSELCEKLLNIYAKPNSIIYDSFMGTGTTAVASKRLGFTYIGSELSDKQCEYAIDRLKSA
jgi:DNA modification methylase